MCCYRDEKIEQNLKKQTTIIAYKVVDVSYQKPYSIWGKYKWTKGLNSDPEYRQSYDPYYPHGLHVFLDKNVAQKFSTAMNTNLFLSLRKYTVIEVVCRIQNLIVAGFSSHMENEKEAVFTEINITPKTWKTHLVEGLS